MNSDDETEKYLTKSSKKRKLLEKSQAQHKVLRAGNEVTLTQSEPMICFNSTSVPDGIPGMRGDYDDVVGLLPTTSDQSSSDKITADLNSRSFSKLPSTSAEDVYLSSTSYSTVDTSHLSSPQPTDNMIYAEFHIAPDANSTDVDYDVINFEGEKLQPKRKEKTKVNNKKAPLPASIELMEDPVRNLWVTSKCHKEQLKDCGHSWNSGMWSKEETIILKENIDRYCKERGIADPTDIIFRASKEDRRDFYPTISSGLNRPLFAVYRRVRRMYDKTNHKGRYSNEEVDKLKRLTEIHGRDWTTIARLLGRSSDSVKDRVRLFKADRRAGKWTPAEEHRLAAAVHSVTHTKHGESVTEGIQWSAVAERVGNRTEKQCRSKWLNYLNWKLKLGSEWTKQDDRLLVQKIAASNPSTENDINWSEISNGWSSVRSPTWLHKKWANLKKILYECGLGDITFTDTVKLLDKLFSEDIFRVWDKPKQLIKFLVGVQKAKNLAAAEEKAAATRKRIAPKKKTLQPVAKSHQEPPTAFIQSSSSEPIVTQQIVPISPDENSCASMTQQSLNSIVRPRSSSDSNPVKTEFDLPSTSTTELICETDEEGSITLPQGTYHLTPTESEGVYIIENVDPSENAEISLPGNMSRVVNITVSPEVLKTVMEQQQCEEIDLADQVGQEYLTQTPTSSIDHPELNIVERDVIVNTTDGNDDVSIYVT